MGTAAQSFANKRQVGSALSSRVSNHCASITLIFAAMENSAQESNAMISTLLMVMVAQLCAISNLAIHALELNALRHAETE